MRVHACHLPPGFEDAPTRVALERAGVLAVTADLTQARLDELCAALIDARAALLATPLSRTIEAIDAATSRLRHEGPARQDLLRALSAFTGFAPAMAEHVLNRISRDWMAPALRRLVTVELGGAEALDGFVTRFDGSRTRAVAPPLGLHVFAGNVPGVSVTSIVRALLVRSATIGKPAAGEPVLAAAFARHLADADPLVGACCAVLYWPGGDAAIENAILRHARLVVHYGGEDAIASLRQRAPADTRFVEHGPRVSFAVVRAAGDLAVPAADLAAAVSLFDQQGCVSPQVAYVIGTPDDARRFAGQLATELDRLASELPRGRLDAAEAAAIHAFRAAAEFRAINGAGSAVWEGAGLSYTIVYDPDPGFSGSCLNRTLAVKSVASAQQLMDAVRPAARYLQTVGIAGFDDAETAALAATLGEIGAARITPIAAMPWPPVAWHHDGRGPLRELIRWVDLER